jgi:hypothetical protein
MNAHIWVDVQVQDQQGRRGLAGGGLAALPRTPRRACPAQRPYGQRGVGEVGICGRERIERLQLRD